MPRSQSRGGNTSGDSESDTGVQNISQKSGYKLFYKEQRNILISQNDKKGYQQDKSQKINAIINDKWEKLSFKEKQQYRKQEDNNKDNIIQKKAQIQYEKNLKEKQITKESNTKKLEKLSKKSKVSKQDEVEQDQKEQKNQQKEDNQTKITQFIGKKAAQKPKQQQQNIKQSKTDKKSIEQNKKYNTESESGSDSSSESSSNSSQEEQIQEKKSNKKVVKKTQQNKKADQEEVEIVEKDKIPVEKTIVKEKSQKKAHSTYIIFFKSLYKQLKERFPKRDQAELSKAVALEWKLNKLRHKNIRQEQFNQKIEQEKERKLQKLEKQEKLEQRKQDRTEKALIKKNFRPLSKPKTLNQLKQGFVKINGEEIKLPKRPVNGYMLFIKEKRPMIIEQYKNITNTEISQKAAEIWKQMNQTEKNVYSDLYQQDILRYKKERQEFSEKYHYQFPKTKKEEQKLKAKNNIKPLISQRKEKSVASAPKKSQNTVQELDIFKIMCQEVPKNFKI